MSESSCEWAFLGISDGDSDGEVALLPRDCGREDSKEAAGSILMTGFA